MTESTVAPLRERLSGLAELLPVFEAPRFEFGSWQGGEKRDDGVITMPYFSLSEQAAAFVGNAYRLGWVLEEFDWPAWAETPEAERLHDNPEALSRATPDQLAKLVTVLIRQDRFVEGALAGAFESGLLTATLRRADSLLIEAAQ